MCMKERINVLSTEMDCITAKEAMLKAIAFLERESVDIIGNTFPSVHFFLMLQ